METSTILAVTGVAATAVFGALSLYLAIKRRYPGQLTFVTEGTIALFHSIVKSLPDLSVLYQDQPVSQGLVLLRGYFLNTGAKDVTESMVGDKISIVLPEGYKWLAAKIISTSPNVNAGVITSEHELTFDTGLLRCKEHIGFYALADVPAGEQYGAVEGWSIANQLEGAMKIVHRIADTEKIQTRELPKGSIVTKRLEVFGRMYVRLSLGVGLLIAMVVLLVIWGLPAEVHYMMEVDSNKPIEVRIEPDREGTVVVKGVGTRYRETMPVEQFFSRKDLKAKIGLDTSFRDALLFCFGLVTFIFFFYGIPIYVDQRQTRRLRSLLGLHD